MGSRKKARAKQRQAMKATKGSIPSVASEPAADLLALLRIRDAATSLMHKLSERDSSNEESFSFDPEDNLDALLDYMNTHNSLNYKILAKYMPNFSRDIQDQKISKDKASSVIMEEFDNRYPSHESQSPNDQAPLVFSLFEKLLGLPPSSLGLTDNNKELWEFQLRLLEAMPVSGASDWGLPVLPVLDDFSDVLDRKFYGGVKGEFRRQCPLINGIADDKAVVDFVERYHLKLCFEVSASIEGVALGVVDTGKRCWECGILPENKVLVCGHCNFACYCSKTCQKKAWSTKHKGTCRELAIGKIMLEADIKTVDAMYADSINDGQRKTTMKFADYSVIVTYIQYRQIFKCISGLGDPSMENFYANMSLVRQGSLWVIKDAISLGAYIDGLDPKDNDAELYVFRCISSLLFFDIGAIGCHFEVQTTLAADLGLPASKMPAERFLQLYESRVPAGLSPLDLESHRNSKRSKRYLVKRAEDELRAVYEGKEHGAIA